jgi:hypothetical protein
VKTVELVHEVPVTHPVLDAPDGAQMALGGIPMERHGDIWLPIGVCRHTAPRWPFLDDQYTRCQGHDGNRAHRHLLAGDEVLLWWTWGNGSTVKRIVPARWS